MALQSSGQITLLDIATEFGGAAPHSISEYYGAGGAPESGQITFANFYGLSAAAPFGIVLHEVGNAAYSFFHNQSIWVNWNGSAFVRPVSWFPFGRESITSTTYYYPSEVDRLTFTSITTSGFRVIFSGGFTPNQFQNCSAVVMSNGNYILTFGPQIINSSSAGYLLCVNSSGTKIWEKRLFTGNIAYLGAIIYGIHENATYVYFMYSAMYLGGYTTALKMTKSTGVWGNGTNEQWNSYYLNQRNCDASSVGTTTYYWSGSNNSAKSLCNISLNKVSPGTNYLGFRTTYLSDNFSGNKSTTAGSGYGCTSSYVYMGLTKQGAADEFTSIHFYRCSLTLSGWTFQRKVSGLTGLGTDWSQKFAYSKYDNSIWWISTNTATPSGAIGYVYVYRMNLSTGAGKYIRIETWTDTARTNRIDGVNDIIIEDDGNICLVYYVLNQRQNLITNVDVDSTTTKNWYTPYPTGTGSASVDSIRVTHMGTFTGSTSTTMSNPAAPTTSTAAGTTTNQDIWKNTTTSHCATALATNARVTHTSHEAF